MSEYQQYDVEKNKARTSAQAQSNRVRNLNDGFRHTLSGGRVMLTEGVAALGPDAAAEVLALVRTSDAFSSDNDPYCEHDFGAVVYEGQQIFWKIDYYDTGLTMGSPDPADRAVTTRVMTVMLPAEY